MNNLFNWLLRLFGLLMAASIGLVVWALYFEEPYLYYQNLPFPELGSVRAGEPVQLSVERCNRDSVIRTYDITRSLINVKTKQVDLLPNVKVSIDPGCHRGISRINVIPASTAPGTYRVTGVAVIPGLMRTHEVPLYSEPFEVVAP